MKTVLCADDNPVDLKYVTKVMLAMDPDIEVHAAHNGIEALALWRELRDSGTSLDLALIDNHMGKFDGKETIEYLRKENFTGPAYILTGDQKITKGQSQDICDVFYKPLNRHHIQEALKRIKSINISDKHFVDTSDLDSLIEDLDAKSAEDQELLRFHCKASCSYRPIGSQAMPIQACIVDINKKGLHILSKESIFKHSKLQIKAPPPLHLDLDVLVEHHTRHKDGFVYDCRFLFIRRALV